MKNHILSSVMAAAMASVSTIAIAQSTTQSGEQPATAERLKQPVGETKKPVDAVQMKTNDKVGSTTAATRAQPGTLVVSEAEGKKWVGKRVYSSTGSDIGEIAEVKLGTDGNVSYFHTDIGGFLGIGETSVQVRPDQFENRDDKLYLNMTQEEAKKLPRVEKN